MKKRDICRCNKHGQPPQRSAYFQYSWSLSRLLHGGTSFFHFMQIDSTQYICFSSALFRSKIQDYYLIRETKYLAKHIQHSRQ